MSPVALITGGQQGVGLGIAQSLVQSGFAVALASNVEPGAEAVRAALDQLGPGVRYFEHDVRDVGQEPRLLEAVEAELGPVDTFVANAGVAPKVRGDLLDVTPDNWDFVINVNLRGNFFLAQEVARRMVASQSDHYRSMIFITSVSAFLVSTERGEYCVSKAGASMVSQLFAVRLAAAGIGVFEVRPGITATQMTSGVKDQYTPRIEDGLVPARRWGQPSDIGQVVVPLATGQMAFATGSIIAADGGLSIPRL